MVEPRDIIHHWRESEDFSLADDMNEIAVLSPSVLQLVERRILL